jgi:RNA polymerase sigma-70 factor, ECF subfamily
MRKGRWVACSAATNLRSSLPTVFTRRIDCRKASVTENELIAASQKGNVGAFNQLVAAYEQQVYNLAVRLLGEQEAAADATQDCFLSAYRSIAKFRGGNFKSWLLRIATNACYDRLRQQHRRPQVSLDSEDDETSLSATLPDGSETPEQYALRRELGREIQQALSTLSMEQRVVVVLSDVQGLSYQEIAEVTTSSIGTVKSRLNRARLKMKEYLIAAGTIPAALPS